MKTKILKLASLLGAAALAVGFMGSAMGATAFGDITVSATVAQNCTISVNPLAFGAYDPIGANASTPLDATTTLTVNCTKGSASTYIQLDAGLNGGGAANNRAMTDGTDSLPYHVYQDSGHTSEWGFTSGTDTVTPAAWTGSSQVFTLYGEIPAAQAVGTGSYSDTLRATINF